MESVEEMMISWFSCYYIAYTYCNDVMVRVINTVTISSYSVSHSAMDKRVKPFLISYIYHLLQNMC